MPAQVIPGVVFQPRSHEGMRRGINQMIDLVRPTLGPRPRVVAVENVMRQKMPEVLDKAGVITRRVIELPDRDADMGAMLVRHVLWKIHDEVGDGTATAAVIFQSVYNQGLRYIAAGGNAMELRRYLERGMREILDELDGLTTRVEGKQQLTQIAESLCFDPSIARLLGEIFDIVGEYGQVDVRTGQGREVERHYVEGMYWSSAILSPYMIADQIKQRTDLADVAVLISDLDLEDPRELMPVLDIAAEQRIPALLVVANKLSDSSIALLLAASREPEKFRAIAVRTPGLGSTEQAAALDDLGVLTGGRPLIKAAGDTLRSLRIEGLGRARRAWADRSYLGIIGGKGDARALRDHLARLRAAFHATEDAQTRTALQQRIGKLLGGSATLLVGGATQAELETRQELARQTASLLRVALREGVVPGGGVAWLRCRPRLRRLLAASTNTDEQAAYRILLRALEEPARTIATNAGFDASTVVAEVSRAAEGQGFDVRCGEVVDMAHAGIYDVAAALRAALSGAVTGAGTALTVDILVHKRKPQETAGAP